MALSLNFYREPINQILTAGNSSVKLVILNRPRKLNSLNHEMVSQILKNLKVYESDSSVKLVILKGNGKGFCAGGDVISVVSSSLTGHWTYPVKFYEKQLILDHLAATYKKPLVCLINGVVMGGGAGLSMNSTFRIVTEKAVFAMPEASLGFFVDVGASYFLSRLPGYFGEFLGLTGARLDGIEMTACGLATHFVHSTKLNALEDALQAITSSNVLTIAALIKTFTEKPTVRRDSPFKRDYNIASHILKRTLSNDFYEGSRAKLFEKDNKPKWEPSKVELVSEEMVDQHFRNINDDEWEPLQLPQRSDPPIIITCRL
ncbi:hypothetical protein PIB30_016787 [Stylosanthes scabra]|uniref:3-hydroxyisobutyryl-CoA hydrolase n=1 Tax=Stylosanthes scabra TaxID=79078 RepID=A0ABU6R7Q2_9FABA|nr:hypothetical protein [Stylosanthes scabra]